MSQPGDHGVRVEVHQHHHHAAREKPDTRVIDVLIGLVRSLFERQSRMFSDDVSAVNARMDKLDATVERLVKANAGHETGTSDAVAHEALSAIGARIDEAEAKVSSLLPPADPTSDPVPQPGPAPSEPAPPSIPAPVFNPDDPTLNGQTMADGVTVRNTPGLDLLNPLDGFDPSKPETA